MVGEQPALAFSHLNVADPSFRKLCVLSPAGVGEFAQAVNMPQVEWCAGFAGVIFPVGSVLRAVESGALQLRSLHATFRETKRCAGANNPTGIYGGRPIARRMLSKVFTGPPGRLFPGEDVLSSASTMGKIQEELGKPMPCTMYPLPNLNRDRQARQSAGLGLKIFQVTDNVATLYRANTPEELADRALAEGRGYDGVVIDTAHIHPCRYDGKIPRTISDNLNHTLEVFKERIRGVHLALGRMDLAPHNKEFQSDTAADLSGALEGQFSSRVKDIMDVAHEAGVSYFTLEVTARSLARALREGRPNVRKIYEQDIAEGYRTLGQAIREGLEIPA